MKSTSVNPLNNMDEHNNPLRSPELTNDRHCTADMICLDSGVGWGAADGVPLAFGVMPCAAAAQ
jgi:hypothetical protein